MSNAMAYRSLLSRFVLSLTVCSVLLVCTAALIGCRNRNPAEPEKSNFTGTYHLISAGGQPLPAVIRHGQTDLKVISGEFRILSNSTCQSVMNFIPPSGQAVTREVEASYVRQGDELHMTWKGAGRTQGRLEGGRFSMNNEGTVFVYTLADQASQ